MDKEILKKHITFIINNIYVVFCQKLYKQTRGIPMGTNCSPLLANLYLHYYEHKFLIQLTKQPKNHTQPQPQPQPHPQPQPQQQLQQQQQPTTTTNITTTTRNLFIHKIRDKLMNEISFEPISHRIRIKLRQQSQSQSQSQSHTVI